MLLQYCGYDVAVTMTSGAPGADANLNVAYLQCYPVVFAMSAVVVAGSWLRVRWCCIGNGVAGVACC